jgi:hypothetical protein
MTARRKMRGAALLLCGALLCGACSDDSNPPAPDSGKGDGPVVVNDSQTPTETSPPPKDGTVTGDQSTAPTTLTAHMEEACSGDLYSINVAPGKETSTCDNIQTLGITYIQVLIGDSEKKPPAAGRTYVVKDPSQVNIYPADGEATASYIAPGGSQLVKSGTFTVDPHAAGATVFTGSFDVTLDNGQQVKASYLSDFCPFDPSDCG